MTSCKNHHFSIGDTSSFMLVFPVSHVRKLLGLPSALFIAYVFYVHLLIEEIRRENHLGYIKPCEQWDKLPVPQLVQDVFHQP